MTNNVSVKSTNNVSDCDDKTNNVSVKSTKIHTFYWRRSCERPQRWRSIPYAALAPAQLPSPIADQDRGAQSRHVLSLPTCAAHTNRTNRCATTPVTEHNQNTSMHGHGRNGNDNAAAPHARSQGNGKRRPIPTIILPNETDGANRAQRPLARASSLPPIEGEGHLLVGSKGRLLVVRSSVELDIENPHFLLETMNALIAMAFNTIRRSLGLGATT